MPDVNYNEINKRKVDRAILEFNKEEIKVEMRKFKKLEEIVDTKNIMVKEYMMNSNITDSRMLFRVRTKMVKLKANMPCMYRRDNLIFTMCAKNKM